MHALLPLAVTHRKWLVSFDEPYWGPYEQPFSRCELWRFRRADGQPWGLAGLWSVWTDKATGEVRESYTMLTITRSVMRLLAAPTAGYAISAPC